MTRREAEELVEAMGGKLCAKVYHRPDGGVLTRNCPAGIRGLSQRLGWRVSWIVSAVLGWSPVAAQERPKKPELGGTLVQIEKSETEGASVNGTIYDPSGAIIPGAAIGLSWVAGRATVQVRSAEDGRYHVGSLAPGEYAVTIQCPGLQTIKRTLALESKQAVRLDATLELMGDVGLVMIEPSLSPIASAPATPAKKAKKKKKRSKPEARVTPGP